jgi:hypothetical protein
MMKVTVNLRLLFRTAAAVAPRITSLVRHLSCILYLHVI